MLVLGIFEKLRNKHLDKNINKTIYRAGMILTTMDSIFVNESQFIQFIPNNPI